MILSTWKPIFRPMPPFKPSSYIPKIVTTNTTKTDKDEDEEDLLKIDIIEDPKCICELNTLLYKGCKCGAMQKELENQTSPGTD